MADGAQPTSRAFHGPTPPPAIVEIVGVVPPVTVNGCDVLAFPWPESPAKVAPSVYEPGGTDAVIVVDAIPLALVVALAVAVPKVNVTVSPEIGAATVVSVRVALTEKLAPKFAFDGAVSDSEVSDRTVNGCDAPLAS